MLTWKEIIGFCTKGNPTPDTTVKKTAKEWEAILTPEQFKITRLKGTERPFSNNSCTIFEKGKYHCICCNAPLFDATIKFDSGTGWPSFTQPIKENAIKYYKDTSFGMIRVETLCNTCNAHLGHVFSDGPPPSGLRYCINSEALQLQKKPLK